MYHKRLGKIILLLLMAAMLLAACGGGDNTSNANDNTANDNATNDNTANNSVDDDAAMETPSGKLVIWVQQANQDVWEQTVLTGFQELYPDVELEFVNYAPDEVANQVALAIQGGTGGPDLGVTQYRDLQALIALQGVMDISSWMAPFVDDFDPDILAYCETDGVYYCTPWDIGPTVTYYRRDIFEAAGLSSDPDDVSGMLATWDSYLDTCISIKEATGLNCFPQNKANNYGLMLIDMMWQQGIGFFDESGAVTIDSPEVASIMEKIGEFWAADVTSDNLDWEDPWYTDFSAAIDNTETPPVATLVYPSWMGGFLKSWIAPDQAGNFGIALMPAWEEGGVRAAMAGGSAYFIPNDSSNPGAAWAFIEYMALNTENQVAQYEYSDYFPTLLSTYDSPLFNTPDPYFGDQLTRPIFAEVAGNVPYAYMYDSQYYNVVSGALATAVQKFAMGDMTAGEALAEAADSVRLETGAP
jgi:lactose/L-arabinose transport system substrate-binding protein